MAWTTPARMWMCGLSCYSCCWVMMMMTMMCASSVQTLALSSSLPVSSKRTRAAPPLSSRKMANPPRQGTTRAFASKLDLPGANENENHNADEGWRLRQQLLETTYDTTTTTTRPPILESLSLSSSDEVRRRIFQQPQANKNDEEDMLSSSSFSSPRSSHPTILRRRLPKTIPYIATLLLGTYVTSCVLTELLANFEWVQAWRYSWPLGMGALYMFLNVLPSPALDYTNPADSIKTTPATDGDSSPVTTEHKDFSGLLVSVLKGETSFVRAILFLLGLGLVIGGAYDLWMPVYETGPNVLTAAGIGQDAALGLFGGTLVQIVLLQQQQQSQEHLHRPNEAAWNRLLPILILLLAQLYKLGEESFEELFISPSSSWWW